MSSTPPAVRDREDDAEDQERYQKRAKLDDQPETEESDKPSVLPPSHCLLGIPTPVSVDGRINFTEKDVGIAEYVGKGVSQIDGIIKQR
jgi:tRNA pseudouridine13 synthase